MLVRQLRKCLLIGHLLVELAVDSFDLAPVMLVLLLVDFQDLVAVALQYLLLLQDGAVGVSCHRRPLHAFVRVSVGLDFIE